MVGQIIPFINCPTKYIFDDISDGMFSSWLVAKDAENIKDT